MVQSIIIIAGLAVAAIIGTTAVSTVVMDKGENLSNCIKDSTAFAVSDSSLLEDCKRSSTDEENSENDTINMPLGWKFLGTYENQKLYGYSLGKLSDESTEIFLDAQMAMLNVETDEDLELAMALNTQLMELEDYMSAVNVMQEVHESVIDDCVSQGEQEGGYKPYFTGPYVGGLNDRNNMPVMEFETYGEMYLSCSFIT